MDYISLFNETTGSYDYIIVPSLPNTIISTDSTGLFTSTTVNYPLNFLTNTLSLGYNTTNLKLTANQINTIQDIATTASPTFNSLTLNGNLQIAGNSQIAGNLQVTSDATIYGNLFVQGTASFIDSTNVNIKDRFLLLNDQYTTNTIVDGGYSVIYQGSTTTTTLSGNFVAGVLGVSNAVVGSTTSPFVVGDYILITNSSGSSVNNGLYEVHSNSAGSLQIKSNPGLNAPTYNMVQTQFTAQSATNYSATKVSISVMKTNLSTGVYQIGKSNNSSSLTFSDLLTTASVTLQQAYNNSTPAAEITLNSTNGALSLVDASSPIGANLFEIKNNALTTNYLSVSSSTLGTQLFTSGSVLFSNGSAITQNNANFYWDNTNNRLGIGNTSPQFALDVNGVGTSILDNTAVLRLKTTANNVCALGFSYNADTGLNAKICMSRTGSGSLLYFMTTSSYASGINVTNCVMKYDGNTGFGTAAPGARIDSLSTAEQLRLSYDVSNYTRFTTSSAGDLTIAPSGNDLAITAKTAITDSTAPQLRLTYTDNSVYTDFQTDSSGYLYLKPTGTNTYVTRAAGNTNFYVQNTATGSTNLYLDSSVFASINSTTQASINITSIEIARMTSTAFGIFTTAPRRHLDVLDTAAAQLRLTYTDNSVYTDFQTDSSGNLYVVPTGDTIYLAQTTGNNILDMGGASTSNSYFNQHASATGTFNWRCYQSGGTGTLKHYISFNSNTNLCDIGVNSLLSFRITPTASTAIQSVAATTAAAQSSPTLGVTGNVWSTALGNTISQGYMQMINITNNVATTTDRLAFFNAPGNGSATEKFCVTTDGYFGINTTNPTYTLQASGNALIGSTAANATNITFRSGGPSGTRNLYINYLAGPTNGSTVGDYVIMQGGYGGVGYVPLSLSPIGGSVGVGVYYPRNILSVSPNQYSTGTASQSGNTVTGTGTTFTSAMVGSQLVYASGASAGISAGTITGFTNATTITVSTSQTITPAVSYYINYTGLQVDSTGNVGINTVGPDRKLDVLDSTNPQLRLTYTDGSVYTDFQTDSSGYLYLKPTGTNTYVTRATGNTNFYVQNTATGSANLNLDSSVFATINSTTQASIIITSVEIARMTSTAFGIFTTSPRRHLDVLDSTNPQLRLTYTDGSVYTDFQTDSNGYLNVFPSGGGVSAVAISRPFTVAAGGSTTDGFSLALFDSGSSPTAGNLYGIGVNKSGVDRIMLGINKNTTTGSVPASACYISTYGSGSALSIGRGGSNNLPSSADIYINSSGLVGINTNNPAKRLEVQDSSSHQLRLSTSSSFYTDIRSDGGGVLNVYSPKSSIVANFQNTIAPADGTVDSIIRISDGRGVIAYKATGTILTTQSTLQLTTNASKWIEIFSLDRGMILGSNSATRIFIDTGGNVGIGNFTPAAPPSGFFTVGSSNQFQINSTGVVTNGSWTATKIGLAYGGTNADLSATGGAGQVLKQTSAGGNITVAQLSVSDLSNSTTGSGAIVLATSPTIDSPVIITPSFRAACTFLDGTGANYLMRLTTGGSLYLGQAALSTSATTGFFYNQSCPGTPANIPTAFVGIATVYDSTNDILYMYNGGWKAITANNSSGTWSPNYTSLSGLSAVSTEKAFYQRIGNVVHGSITAKCTPSGLASSFNFSSDMPIIPASTFSTAYDVIYSCQLYDGSYDYVRFYSVAATRTAVCYINLTASSSAVFRVCLTFTYSCS